MKKFIFVLLIITLGYFLLQIQKGDPLIIDKNEVRRHLHLLYSNGYSIPEMSLRIQSSVEDLSNFYHGEDCIDSTMCIDIEKIYQSYKDNKIEPIRELSINATDALWEIHKKTQKLPFLSLYTKIDVTHIANALHNKCTLNNEDSIKALVAYVNMIHGIDTIPDEYPNLLKYYYPNEGIGNIIIPSDFHSSVYPKDQLAKIDYYLWKAEQFELMANLKLIESIKKNIREHVESSIDTYMDHDVNSFRNDMRYLFKDESEIDSIYKEKLIKRLNISGLSASLKKEILEFCISINCSRAVLVDDLLGFSPVASNLNINQLADLEEFKIQAEKQNQLLYIRKRESAVTAGTQVISLVALGNLEVSWPIMLLSDAGLYSVCDQIERASRVSDYSIDSLNLMVSEELTNSFFDHIYSQLGTNDTLQIQKALDEDVLNYYKKIRNNIGL